MILPPIRSYRITTHALQEMARRNISEEEVAKVLASPEQAEMIRTGRVVYQVRIEQGEPLKEYLLRVLILTILRQVLSRFIGPAKSGNTGDKI